MKVMVTGGAGYIGSHAVYELIENGNTVVVVDNLSTGHLEAIHPNALFYRGDLRDRAFLKDVFATETPEAVLHFAAASLVGESMENPLKYYDNNVMGTLCLLEAMGEWGTDKIVFSSTAAVYGEPEASPLKEHHLTQPVNPYGETKRAMEQMIKWVAAEKSIGYVALRYFNVAGAHPQGVIGEAHQPETHLIPLILQVPLGKRETLHIYGDQYPTKDGTCVRDYIHIIDLVHAHMLALNHLVTGGCSEVYNLGTGSGCTVLEMLEAARKVTGHDIPAQIAPSRAGDPAVLVASYEKAQKQLGWEPEQSSIEAIIASAWQFHRTHPNGYKE